jgi:ribosomal protein L9
VTIDRRKIHIEHPIKGLGDYTADIKLGQSVTAKLKVTVSDSPASA